jgi:predicted RNA-binding protein with PUA-like domain
MPYFLAKTEPSTYSIDDLARDGRTVWDGVTNPQAAKAISQMKPGDLVLIYHSGGQSAIAGLARVAGAPRTDPKQPKSWIVDLEFVSRLDPPTTLADVKTSGLFADFSLVKQSRLSTMACPAGFIDWLRRRYPDSRL